MIALLAVLLAVVNAPYTPASYACDGVTVAYTVNFPYLTQSDLAVTSTTAGGAVTNLILTTDYLLSVTSTTSTATLTLQAGSKCPNGSTLKIVRQMACTQPTVLRQQTTFNPQTVEAMSDRNVMCSQQIQAQVATTQNLNFGSLNTFTATQTFAPGAGSDATVHTASGSGRAIVATSVNGTGIVATSSGTGVPIVATSSATSGVATQFATGNAVNGPIQITPQASDPSTPANGEVWINSTSNTAKVRTSGTSKIFAGNPTLIASTSAGQSILNATVTIVVFGTVTLDSDAAYNSGTGQFTVPAGKGGTYLVSSSIMYVNALAGVMSLNLYKNAVIFKAAQTVAPGATQTLTHTSISSLAAGDVIDLRTSQSSGGAQALWGDGTFVYLSIKRLSD